ncbi:MAG TPA: Rieske 2Fe-2S domain-containing protein, partial [Rhizomicrobium sp.]|nr:Rieske 2Fe-2S domain-containing protein [Rhizomicrobium sp.]
MAEEEAKPKGPDLAKGVTQASFAENGMLSGHVGGEDVLLVKRGADVFALSPHCTHYHGPLADGLVVDGTIRCPWHHA